MADNTPNEAETAETPPEAESVGEEPFDAGIVEEAPGLGPDEVTPGTSDPADGSGFGRAPDLGLGIDDAATGDAADAGAGLGSTLLDDLDAGATPDLPGLTDAGGGIGDITEADSAPPAFEDRGGWAMDGGHQDPEGGPVGGSQYGMTDAEYAAHHLEAAAEAIGEGDAITASYHTEWFAHYAAEAAESGEVYDDSPAQHSHYPDEPVDHWGDPFRRQRPSEDSTPGTTTQSSGDSTPVPDEIADPGGKGPLDPTAGGEGGDPAPETEEFGRGGLIGTGGDVDPDPDLDGLGGAGALDTVTAGMGAIDPADSTLLGGDEGDLAVLAEEPDAGVGLEIDLDDSLGDLDLEEGA